MGWDGVGQSWDGGGSCCWSGCGEGGMGADPHGYGLGLVGLGWAGFRIGVGGETWRNFRLAVGGLSPSHDPRRHKSRTARTCTIWDEVMGKVVDSVMVRVVDTGDG